MELKYVKKPGSKKLYFPVDMVEGGGNSGGSGAGDIVLSCTLDRESNQDEIGANGATCSHTFEEIIALLENKSITSVSVTTYPGAASQDFRTSAEVGIELYKRVYEEGLDEPYDENITYLVNELTWPGVLAQTEFIRFRCGSSYAEFQVQPEGVSVYLSFE